MKITDLRAEDALNPIGLWTRKPSLSWRMIDSRRGARQTAYRVLVASGATLLNAGEADRWDSGTIQSAQSVGVPYSGVALGGLERCHWTVLVTDELGTVTRAVDSAWFETALDATAWQAGWIGWTGGWAGKALAFRRVLQIVKPVVKARLCISGLGYYEASVNGIRIGAQVLDPAWTDYSNRVYPESSPQLPQPARTK